MAAATEADGKGARPRDRSAPPNGQFGEMYRLVGAIVCTEQEVANKIEMCVEHLRNAQEESHGMPGSVMGGTTMQHTPETRVPEKKENIEKKANCLKPYRLRAETGLYRISGEEFVRRIMDSENNRNTIAHSVIVRGGGTVKNLRWRAEHTKEDLERSLEGIRCTLLLVNRLYLHFGLEDCDEVVRRARKES